MESFMVGNFLKLVKDPFIQKGTKQQQQKNTTILRPHS